MRALLVAFLSFNLVGLSAAGAEGAWPPLPGEEAPVPTSANVPSCEYLLELVYRWGTYYEQVSTPPIDVGQTAEDAAALVAGALANTKQAIIAYQHFCLPV